MKLIRSGSRRNHGWSTLFDANRPPIVWNEKDSKVVLSAWHVRDVTSESTYDYNVELSLADISRIIQVLSEKALAESPNAVAKGITDSPRHLLRLLLTSTGLLTDPKALLAAIKTDNE